MLDSLKAYYGDRVSECSIQDLDPQGKLGDRILVTQIETAARNVPCCIFDGHNNSMFIWTVACVSGILQPGFASIQADTHPDDFVRYPHIDESLLGRLRALDLDAAWEILQSVNIAQFYDPALRAGIVGINPWVSPHHMDDPYESSTQGKIRVEIGDPMITDLLFRRPPALLGLDLDADHFNRKLTNPAENLALMKEWYDAYIRFSPEQQLENEQWTRQNALYFAAMIHQVGMVTIAASHEYMDYAEAVRIIQLINAYAKLPTAMLDQYLLNPRRDTEIFRSLVTEA